MQDEGTRHELEALFDAFLERSAAEGDAVLEELCREHPQHAPELKRRVAVLREAGLLAEEASTDAFPERLGDFRLLHRIGGGGMGIVYLARQESLGRDVALKLIRPDLMYFPGARERFRREVTAVASLQHPGIVPVYTVGEESGIPYFAMEHVRGFTLAEVLQCVAGHDPESLTGADIDRALALLTGGEDAVESSPIFDGCWVDVCLKITREIAEALEHAHRRGILHRDIKPSNVMITRSGRVMLFDFGLTRIEEGERITRTGSVLGSLPYMAPEQIEEAADSIDQRTDVYQLGVTLYELLTLRLPYRGKSVLLIKESILAAAPESVRLLNAQVSWEAETVCRMAMDAEPGRRYATCAGFARDLSNVLERRPIEARRAGVVRRARRWVQRHPAWTVGAAMGALLVVTGPSVFAWQQYDKRIEIGAKNDQLQQAIEDVEKESKRVVKQKRRADERFRDARDAVESMLTRVATADLQHIPEMGSVRLALLEDALGFYTKFVDEGEDDPTLHVERAVSYYKLATVYRELGRLSEAGVSAERAIELFEDEGRTESPPESFTADHAKSWALLGRTVQQNGEYDKARVSYETALSVLEDGLPQDTASEVELLDIRAHTNGLLAGNLWETGQRADAKRVRETSVGAYEALFERDQAAYMLPLAEHLAELATYLAEEGNHAEAEPLLDRAKSLAEDAIERLPDRARHTRQMLAQVQWRRGMLSLMQSRYEESVARYRQAVELGDLLVTDFPHLGYLRRNRIISVTSLGEALVYAGELDGAHEVLARGRSLAEEHLASSPSDLGIQGMLCMLRQTAARALWKADRGSEAVAALEEALEREAQECQRHAELEPFRRSLVLGTQQLLDYHLERGALSEFERAAKRMCETYPESAENRFEAFEAYARALPHVADPSHPGADAEAAAARFELNAVEALEAAVQLGFDDWGALDSKPEFKPLLDHPRVQKLLSEMR